MREEVRRLFEDPPPGSATARARDYGMDLTLTVRNLQLSPSERLAHAERARRFILDLKRARERRSA
ncbi:MAG TPA: hypothetical protein VHT05_08180 [Candidatus Elarobacter sp.]|jgi:hypothetical protein|nr:hypothetical protein [Candidatus Elarobacter sp.]